jgi:TP901 family phage tail tape measure protein
MVAAGRIDTLRSRSAELRNLYAASGGRDLSIRAEMIKINAEYRKAQAEAAKYGTKVGEYARAHTNASAEIRKTGIALAQMDAKQKASARRKELRGQLFETVAPALALAAPVKWAIDFESGMADAAKTIDGMRDSAGNLTPMYYEMEKAAKEMGRTLPLAHKEIASLFAAGGQLGMTEAKSLKEFTELSAHMAVAFGMSTEQSADAVGGYMTKLGISIQETRELLDLMNYYANTGSASEKGISDIVNRTVALGKVSGVSAKPMIALAATFDALKVDSSIAATGIKNFLVALTKGSAATKQQQKAYAMLGIDPVKLSKQMQIDSEGAILSVINKIKSLPKDKHTAIMTQIFGQQSLEALMPLLDRSEIFIENLRTMGNESEYTDAVRKEFENRARTTANSLMLLTNRVKEVGVTVASVLLPPLNKFIAVIGPGISAIADFAAKHETLTTAVIGTIAGFLSLKVAGIGAAYAASSMGSGIMFTANKLLFFIPAMRNATSVGGVLKALLGGLGVAIKGLGGAIKFMFGPVGFAIISVLTIAAIGFKWLYDNCEGFRNAVTAVFDWILDIPNKISRAFESVSKSIRNLLSGLPGISVTDDFGGGQVDLEQARKLQAEVKAAYGSPNSAAQAVEQGKVAATFFQSVAKQAALEPEIAKAAQAPAPKAGAAAKAGPAAKTGVAASPFPSAVPGSLPAGAPGVAVNLNFSLNGVTDEEFSRGVINAINRRKGDFEGIISSIVHDQMRVSYGY